MQVKVQLITRPDARDTYDDMKMFSTDKSHNGRSIYHLDLRYTHM